MLFGWITTYSIVLTTVVCYSLPAHAQSSSAIIQVLKEPAPLEDKPTCEQPPSEIQLQLVCVATNLYFLEWRWNKDGEENLIFSYVPLDGHVTPESNVIAEVNFTSTFIDFNGTLDSDNSPIANFTATLVIAFTSNLTSYGMISCGDHQFNTTEDMDEYFEDEGTDCDESQKNRNTVIITSVVAVLVVVIITTIVIVGFIAMVRYQRKSETAQGKDHIKLDNYSGVDTIAKDSLQTLQKPISDAQMDGDVNVSLEEPANEKDQTTEGTLTQTPPEHDNKENGQTPQIDHPLAATI